MKNGISGMVKKITNNEYVYSIIAKVFAVLTGFVYSIVYSRYMQAELRGYASVIINYAELIMLVLSFGIYQGYPFFRKKEEKMVYHDYINMVAGILCFYTIIGFSLIFLLRPSIEYSLVIVLVPMMLGTKLLNYCVLIEKPKVRNTASMYLNIIDILIVVVLMLISQSNFKICIVYLFLKEFIYFVSAVARLQVNILSIRPTLKNSGKYIKFGFIPMLTIIMMEINYKADVLMLDYYNISKSEIGVYTLGVSLAQKIWMIPDALKDILVSKLAKGKSIDEVARINRISLGVVMFFVVGLMVLGQSFINILYGASYKNSYNVLIVLLVGIVGMVFYKMVYSYNVISGHRVINFVFLGVAALANIIINIILIPRFGTIGAAFASTVSYLVCGVSFLLFFCHNTHTKISDMILIKRSDIQLIKNIVK